MTREANSNSDPCTQGSPNGLNRHRRRPLLVGLYDLWEFNCNEDLR